MPHIQITCPHPTLGGRAQLIVDGHDLSQQVLAQPFDIDPGDPQTGHPPTVTIAIVADQGLDIDLPDGVLAALAAGADTGEPL